jgi:hypothetical protein
MYTVICKSEYFPSLPYDIQYLNFKYRHPFIEIRDNSVGIALDYGLDDRGSRVRFQAGAGNFSLHHASRTALGPTQPPTNGYQGLFPGVKAAGA